MSELASQRREFRNLNVLTDLPGYRLPAAGWVSILHRVSGALLFALLPFIIWMFDTSVSSEISFERFKSAFSAGLGWLPGGLVRLAALALIWAYLHHLIAGLRHLYLDVDHEVGKAFGRVSAIATLVLSLALTLALGLKLFGLF